MTTTKKIKKARPSPAKTTKSRKVETNKSRRNPHARNTTPWYRLRTVKKKFLEFMTLVDGPVAREEISIEEAFSTIYEVPVTPDKIEELLNNKLFMEEHLKIKAFAALPITKNNLVKMLWERLPNACDSDACRLSGEISKLLGFYAPSENGPQTLIVDWKSF
jgi:hypothetical protein